MFQRIYHEFDFLTLKLHDGERDQFQPPSSNNHLSSSLSSSSNSNTLNYLNQPKIQTEINNYKYKNDETNYLYHNNLIPAQLQPLQIPSSSATAPPPTTTTTTTTTNIINNNNKLTFLDVIKDYEEKFIMVQQSQKPLFLDIKMSDIVKLFSTPICAKADGLKLCNSNCECDTSMEIGIQLYERGCVHSFHQIGTYLVGSLAEQQTTSLSKVGIKFDKDMKTITTIYCPCRLHYCPHAFAIIYFRMKLKNFYILKLPFEMFYKEMPQNELIKFYSFFIEEARSLPIVKDYHSRCWTSEQASKQTNIQTPYLYAYCHKNLLPIDFAILEEQTRARKWISDLYLKRTSQSQMSSLVPIASAGEIFTLGDQADINSGSMNNLSNRMHNRDYGNNNNNNNKNNSSKQKF